MNSQDWLRRVGEEEKIPILRSEEERVFEDAVRQANPMRILEVGTGIGYSTFLLALWAPQAIVMSIESFQERYKRARSYLAQSGVFDRIELCYGRAEEILPRLEGEFDLVYLDGPKGHYLRHLRLIEPHLTERATVIADNVLFRGYVEATAVVPRRMRTIAYRMKNYLDYVMNSGVYNTTLYRLGDGIAVSQRKGKA